MRNALFKHAFPAPQTKPDRHIGAQAAGFLRKNTVLVIAAVLAAATMIAVPPDAVYLTYFDLKTLTCLFCTLAVVCALRNVSFFTILAQKIVKIAGNTRTAVLALVYITFLGSMLIANDMALLTFLPLGYFVLSAANKEKYMAFTFIMQNISANLGGMLTPFGNPQNLYLYTKFHISNGTFIRIMLPPFLFAVLLITVCCFLIPKENLVILKKTDAKLPPKRTALYLALFIFTILMVFRTIPYYTGLLIVTLILLIADRSALRKVDYPLLLTFAAFFIFAGNMSRIDAVRELFTALLQKNTLLVSIASCQVISNVPSAILLSQFTQNYAALLMGVNVGGVGTLISSLASLITFRSYTAHYRQKTAHYLGLFTLLNFAFLILLTAFCLLIVYVI